MSGANYGVMIEFTGSATFTNGAPIFIFHDDGVSLEIDGVLVPGFSPGSRVNPESVTLTGTTGTHSFDLL
jgi:hypothetical protein